MTVGVRDPGYLPNVLARVEKTRALLAKGNLEADLREAIEAILALATTQHELNKRLWEGKKGVPEPHADSHIWGDDALGGNLGGGNLKNINVRTVTSSTTLLEDEWLIRADASGGAITVTLPPAADRPGRLVAVAKIDTVRANEVTIAASGSDTIAGEASFDLRLESEVLSLISDEDGSGDWTVV
jgi:hypothetical protein